MSKWDVVVVACCSSNVQRYFDSGEPWGWYAWGIVLTGLLLIAMNLVLAPLKRTTPK